jgi:hypothetical protein
MTTPDYRAELENIVNAKRFDRDIFADDTEFADWALSRARALLAAPEAVGEVEELVAALEADAECAEAEHYDLCNMTAEQLRRAATLLQQISAPATPPAPVPVGSSLWRQEGWCDTEGYCWAFFNRRWELWQPSCLDATVLLLPHWALPLPEAQP